MADERLNETARMQQEARKRRLKAALRANLQRRKERARDADAPQEAALDASRSSKNGPDR